MAAHALYEIEDDRPDWDRDDHADEAEEAAEQEDREQYPEAAETGRVAEDARAEDIAVELLQDQDEDEEVYTLYRARQQNQDEGWDRTDERAEKRNHVRYADDDGNEHRVRHLHKAQAEEAEPADDEGVDDLADDESAEDPVDVGELLHHMLCPLLRKQREGQPPGFSQHGLLDVQKVDHHDESDEDVLKPVDHRPDTDTERRHDALHVRHQMILQEIHDVLIRDVVVLLHGFPYLRIVLKIGHDVPIGLCEILRQRRDQVRDGAVELRDDHRYETDRQYQYCQKRYQGSCRTRDHPRCGARGRFRSRRCACRCGCL